MFISRKLAVGRGTQAAGGPPGHPHPPAGGHAKKPFLLWPSARPEKKDLFSLREVARIGNIETWAPQISMEKGTELSFLQNHHCRGRGSCSGDREYSVGGPARGVGGGWAAPSPSASSWPQLCTRGWVQRGFDAAPSTFSL